MKTTGLPMPMARSGNSQDGATGAKTEAETIV
jgi:hypothetical protein